MAGYAARSSGTTGILDPTTARAAVLDGAAIVAVDVCALHEVTCDAIREQTSGAVEWCIVTATHTHSGPCAARGRLGPHLPDLEERIIKAAVAAIRRAAHDVEPCSLDIRSVRGLEIAHDRRRDRVVDPPLSVVTARRRDGTVHGTIAHFACHPVVIDGANTLISGDYPAALREELERLDGGTAVFLTGCAGDINTGHTAESSYAPTGLERRSPGEARRIGGLMARAVGSVPRRALSLRPLQAAICEVSLPIDAVAPADVAADRSAWTVEYGTADSERRALLRAWIDWADRILADPDPSADGASLSWTGRVTVLHLGELVIAALPGEPFLVTADRLESAFTATGTIGAILVLGYADGVPGYVPPLEAYRDGGYEVVDAHRYYSSRGPFVCGAAESLEAGALEALARATGEGRS